MILPLGPVPTNLDRSIPAALAAFWARGLTNNLSPVGYDWATGDGLDAAWTDTGDYSAYNGAGDGFGV